MADLRSLLEDLAQLGSRIGAAIEGDPADQLLELMAEKDRLTSLANDLWPTGELPGELAELVAVVHQNDTANLVALQGRIGSTEGRLLALRASLEGSLSYRERQTGGVSGARFLDRRG